MADHLRYFYTDITYNCHLLFPVMHITMLFYLPETFLIYTLNALSDSPLVVCRSEMSGGLHVYSIREDSTSINIIAQPAQSEPNLFSHSIPQWNISTNGDKQNKYKQDIPAAQYIQEIKSIQHNKSESAHAGPEYLVCTGPRGGEGTTGELVLMVASTQNQAPNTGLTREEAQKEALHLGEGGLTTLVTSGGPETDKPPSEQMMLNETKYDLNDSSSQTRMFLQGSTVVFSDEPLNYGSSGKLVVPLAQSQPSQMTFDPSQGSSHTVTETPDVQKAREGAAPSPWSSVKSPESNPVQPMDCLPTFTSQRPPDLPTTMGKRAVSNTWNINNTTPYDYRCV